MKKIIILILSLLLCTCKIYAYENEYFKIDINENFILDENTNNNTYKWTNENKYIAITISDNTKLKYNISKFTETDIENQKKYLEESYNKTLSKYNISLEIKDININEEKTELNYYLYYPSKEAMGHDIYQKGTMYTTDHYILNLVYSSDEEINDDNEEYKNLKSSFQVLDEPIKEINLLYLAILLVITIVIVIAFIVVLVKVRKRRA